MQQKLLNAEMMKEENIMSKRKFNMSVEETTSTIPRIWWEKMFYFDGGDGHRVIYGHHIAGGFFAISNYNIYC